ncbi:MAG: YraN family protein [Granulosicoccus sp.]
MQKKQQGSYAEKLVRLWLESKRFTYISGNFVRRVGEIDLIMRSPDERTIVFVEVRYRRTHQFGGAIESVDLRKQKKLRLTANAWLQKHADSHTTARIDVIALSPRTGQTPGERLWHDHELIWIKNAVES